MDIKKQIISRFTYIYWAFWICFVAIVLSVLYINVFRQKYFQSIQRNIVDHQIEARRGDILDINGRLLATTQTKYTITMDPNTDFLRKGDYFNKTIDSLCDSLAFLFKNMTSKQFKDTIMTYRKKGSRDVVLVSDIDYFKFKRCQKFPIFNKGKNRGGFKYIKTHEIILLHGNLGRRIIGFENSLDEFFGIEKQMNSTLVGTNGLEIAQSLGKKHFLPIYTIKQPIDGYDVVSTIDINMQDVVDKALRNQLIKEKAQSGVAIVMDVQTGEIRALVNLSMTKDSNYSEIQNMAISSLYAPGSVMKLASVMIAFEKNSTLTPDKVYDTGNGIYNVTEDFSIKDYNYQQNGFGKISIQQIFEMSSNVGIAMMIKDVFKQEREDFVNRLSQFYFDRTLSLGIDHEPVPQYSKPGQKNWSGISMLQMSIGYEIMLTPMHLITFYNAVANNGKMVKPMFVKRILNVGQTVKEFETEVLVPSICSDKTLNYCKKMLLGVVETGTGKDYVKSDIVSIAGKSGTAQILKDGKYETGNVNATFIGYFPADKPKYTCLVWISEPKVNKSGAGAAGPVLKEIAEVIYTFDYDLHQKDFVVNNFNKVNSTPAVSKGFSTYTKNLFNLLGFKFSDSEFSWVTSQSNGTNYNLKPITIKKGFTPDVRGMNARDAVCLLEQMGFTVKLYGAGRVVSQSIEPGVKFSENQTIKLNLEI